MRKGNIVLIWLVQNNGIRTMISLITIIILLIFLLTTRSVSIKDLINFTIFFTVIAALLLDVSSIFIEKLITNIVEDKRKLSVDYDDLAKRYQDAMITFSNDIAEGVDCNNLQCLLKICSNDKHTKRQELSKEKYQIKFPVTYDIDLQGKRIDLHDKKDMYQIPEKIKVHYEELIKAHKTSNVYNQLNIRMDQWKEENGVVHFYTSRTTYFDSLVTNRAMDYVLSNGLTNRDFFGYGPFIPELQDSKLSNHLGFNGFIESFDGFIPFVRRNSIVSIGKRTYGSSVGASLKCKYALNKDFVLTIDGIRKAILCEIKDELKINEEQLEPFDLTKNLLAAYRDWVEGGKPQLLFFAKACITKDEINEQFSQKLKEKKKLKQNVSKKELSELEDGKKLLWINRDDIMRLAIAPGVFVHEGKEYQIMPSASAAIVILREYMVKGKIE